MTEEEKTEETKEKQERKTLAVEELLLIANEIGKNLVEEHHLTSAEVLFVGTILQASTTTDYMIHNLLKRANVHVVEMRPEHPQFKPGEN